MNGFGVSIFNLWEAQKQCHFEVSSTAVNYKTGSDASVYITSAWYSVVCKLRPLSVQQS